MPNRVLCPRCRKTGLVRSERIVKGSTSNVAYFCGACQYAWHIADVQRDAVVAKRRPPGKPREKTEKSAAKPKAR